MAAAPSVTITSVLQTIFDDVGEPLLVKAIAAGLAAIPVVGIPLSGAWRWLMNAPIIGAWLQGKLKATVDNMIAQGVINIKIGILRHLSTDARAKWKPQVDLLEQYNAEGKTLSPEEQAAYDAALQNLVKSHPGTVGA